MISRGRRPAGRDATSREAGRPLTSSAVAELAEAWILDGVAWIILDGVAIAAGRFELSPNRSVRALMSPQVNSRSAGRDTAVGHRWVKTIGEDRILHQAHPT
jgi:hypothetical protein